MKREYLKVNVPQTCEDIMDFIMVRVPPPVPGAARPRFSLYLSAQLQYGVILVYIRQCQYLFEEIQHILERLHRTQQKIRIDMTDLEQPGLLLPNQMAIMEALEEAPDPFFGLMEPLLPSPIGIPHIRYILEAPTPEKTPPGASPSPRRRRTTEPHTTISPDAITLKEAEPIVMLTIEGEQDIPEITAREIDMLMEQDGFQVALGEEDTFTSPQRRRAIEESAEKARQEEAFLPLELSPPTGIKEVSSAAKDTGFVLTEEALLPGEAPLLPLEMTPIPGGPRMPPPPPSPLVGPGLEHPPQVSPELVLPEYEQSPTRPRRRRRQLHYIDDITQISRGDFQEQIANTEAQCQPLDMVLLPAKRKKMAADLLGMATYGWMHPTLQGLWSQRAKLQRMDYAWQRALEEQAQRAEEEERVQKAEVLSELEGLRAAEEVSVPPTASSEISLETTGEEQRPSLVMSEERIPLEPDEAALALAVVPELPEISFELPLEKDQISLDYVRRFISSKLEQVGEVEFSHLVPLTTSRLVASRFFYMCLVLSATQQVRLEQAEPYGRIHIRPGPLFHHH